LPASSAPAEHTLVGVLTLSASRNPENPLGCAGYAAQGQADIAVGAVVTVKDASGTIVAIGALDKCSFVVQDPQSANALKFHYTVANVPDASFYQVGLTGRGALTISEPALVQSNWTLNLALA